jgi:hypothetical protein
MEGSRVADAIEGTTLRCRAPGGVGWEGQRGTIQAASAKTRDSY